MSILKANRKPKTSSKPFTWVDPHTDKEYRIIEAFEDFRYFVRAEDYEGAVCGDPANCVDARAIRRTDKQAEAVYIGAGSEAYVCYGEEIKEHDAVAVHYLLGTDAKAVRDHFEATKGQKPIAQVVTLRAPTPSTTVQHKHALEVRRRIRVKSGAPIKHRGPNKNPTRKMMYPRPRPTIIGDFVTMPIV